MVDPYRIGRALNTPMHRVTEYVYIGNRSALFDQKLLKNEGICSILQLLDFQINPEPEYEFMCIVMNDSEEQNLGNVLPMALRFIHQAVVQRKKILVHCNAGVSRSGSVVTAYLMAVLRIPFSQALAAVQDKRACVDPNPGFAEFLAKVGLDQLRNMID